MKQQNRTLLLGSNSPRRQEILSQAGIYFEIDIISIDESFPNDIIPNDVAAYISEQKANAFLGKYPDKVILTADTVVILDGKILGKPKDSQEAKMMLHCLSNKTHEVITAFSLIKNDIIRTFQDSAYVSFNALTDQEINYYVDHYSPLDKAGAYGIQEWIGMIAVNKIEGSFYTIMGLPIHMVYKELQKIMLE